MKSNAQRHPSQQGDTSLALRCVAAENEVERLRTVLRALISCGGTSATIRAIAMNTLEPGSGDIWLGSTRPGEDEWDGDRALPEDPEIKAAFPTRSGRHDLYAEARRLVAAKHSKGALVALVNWLLHRATQSNGEGGNA